MNETQMQHGADWIGQDLTGRLLSEKFNGCRVYWDGATLWTRGGLAANLPAAWAANLPAMPLDGELYDGPDGVHRCATALRFGRFLPTMTLVVFDAPGADGDYAARLQTAAAAISGCAFAQTTPLTVCRDNAQAVSLLREIQSRGGEGIMARTPSLKYAPGRTHDLLKVKTADDGPKKAEIHLRGDSVVTQTKTA